ncbi:esterase-like activity of phytase family protein [Zavarzinia compransoris]|uniref:esterase-like activity of phytase family protein n=1 Tax=Zavarzinia marina TaxID=2911065 RepID=UPI001F41F734|nr:esterase-like activity of phytase family protein [Zavarzinia marina]MCF4166779.1 esterase-like activity of phytase family protein [Zavarzinia marina]
MGARLLEIRRIALPVRPFDLGKVKLAGGRELRLSLGIGSGLSRRPGDPPGRLYAVTDRGPNIACEDAKDILGEDAAAPFADMKDGKIFPQPDFQPSIIALDIAATRVRLASRIGLHGAKGEALTGLPNPLEGEGAPAMEGAFDLSGAPIALDPGGIDTESVAASTDGTFWVGEEYGPSLLHVDGEGTVMERIVPKGMGRFYRKAPYPVRERLPEVFARRRLNRGFEGLTISPDGRFLHFMTQSALGHPEREVALWSRNIRLVTFDVKKREVECEHLYRLDKPDSFKSDKGAERRHVKVGDMSAVGPYDLLVVERVEKSSKIFHIRLTADQRLDADWLDVEHRPTLEETDSRNLRRRNVPVLEKRLILDSDRDSGLPPKIEGLSWFDERTLVVIDDDDFGIRGERSAVHVLRFDGPII